MIGSLKGSLVSKNEGMLMVEVGGVGFLVRVSKFIEREVGLVGSEVKLLTHLNVKEDALELFGFLTELELYFFQKLIGVNGVGPKTALAVLGVAPVDDLITAINAGRPDLLTKASGIGKKTAERVVLELRGKVIGGASTSVKKMEGDLELEEVLVGLGYGKGEVREALKRVPLDMVKLEERLKAALKFLRK